MSINSWKKAVERRVQLKKPCRSSFAIRDTFFTRSILFYNRKSFEHRQDYICNFFFFNSRMMLVKQRDWIRKSFSRRCNTSLDTIDRKWPPRVPCSTLQICVQAWKFSPPSFFSFLLSQKFLGRNLPGLALCKYVYRHTSFSSLFFFCLARLSFAPLVKRF